MSEQTNFDRITSMSIQNFWHQVLELQHHPFARYIDFPAWLAATDTDLKHFIKKYSECIVKPSSDSRDTYVIYGVAVEKPEYNAAMHEAYVTVADFENARLLKVPACQVIFLPSTETDA